MKIYLVKANTFIGIGKCLSILQLYYDLSDFIRFIPQQKDRLHICLLKSYNSSEITLPDT